MTTRQRRRFTGAHVCHANLIQHVTDLIFLKRSQVQLWVKAQTNVLRNCQVGKQVLILKQHRQRPLKGCERREIVALPKDAAGL